MPNDKHKNRNRGEVLGLMVNKDTIVQDKF
jgi:hypothetical protein